MQIFGGFQAGAFQSDFQTSLIQIDIGPSTIVFLPVSTNAQVPELSDYYAQISYFDIFGDAYTPDTVQYQIWDDTNKTIVLDWTSVPYPGTSNVVDLPSACNALGNAKNLSEVRVVVFSIVTGGAQRYDEATYYVNAVPGVASSGFVFGVSSFGNQGF